MTTSNAINTIEDLARILQEQPTWAEAIRSLILTQELLELPARFAQFVEAQQGFNEAQRGFNEEQRAFNQDQREFNEAQREFNEAQREFNEAQREFNRLADRRFNSIEGRLGNLEGKEYERSVRTKALARSLNDLGFETPYIALNQDGLVDPRLMSAITQADRNNTVARADSADLFETDLIISSQGNRHLLVEVSLTADKDDVDRARSRANLLAGVTGGEVVPMVITSRLNAAQRNQAISEEVTIFLIPYP